MPIYEFKCGSCHEFFEVLIVGSDEDRIIKCPKCESESFERVLSSTNYTTYTTDAGRPKAGGASQTTRTCSSGSCTTYEIPGYSR